MKSNYARNKPYAKPGNYNTKLSPQEEQAFRQWTKQNSIPFDFQSPVTDYDMRGFWKAQIGGDQAALRDSRSKHFPDKWKTPYHETFSNQSQWAAPGAPHWEGDKLVRSAKPKPTGSSLSSASNRRPKPAPKGDKYAPPSAYAPPKRVVPLPGEQVSPVGISAKPAKGLISPQQAAARQAPRYNANILHLQENKPNWNPIDVVNLGLNFANRASYAGQNALLGRPIRSIEQTSSDPVEALAPGLKDSKSFLGGVARSVLSLDTAQNLATIGGIGALSGMTGVAPKVLSKLIDGYFGLQGAQMVNRGIKTYRETGNASAIGESIIGGFMAAAATYHALPARARTALRTGMVEALRNGRIPNPEQTVSRILAGQQSYEDLQAGKANARRSTTRKQSTSFTTPGVPEDVARAGIEGAKPIRRLTRPKPPTPKPEDVIGRAFNVVKTGDLYSVVSDNGKAMLMTRDAAKAHDYANDLNKKSQASVGTSKRPTVNMEKRRGAQAQSDAKPTPAPPAAATPQAWRPSPDRVYNVAKVGKEFRVMDDTGKFVVVKDKAGNVVKQSMSEKEAHAFAGALNRNRGFELPKPTVKGKGPESTENSTNYCNPKSYRTEGKDGGTQAARG